MSFLNFAKPRKHTQSGQTLIETVVGIFVLVTGIAAALGLAVYALNASRNVNKQIVASGLAREGIEAVKNMRDTNWLKGPLSINGCYDYVTLAYNAASCHKDWMGSSTNATLYCLNSSNTGCDGAGGNPGFYVINFNPTAANFWTLKQITATATDVYGLGFDQNAPANNRGMYYSLDSVGNPIPCAGSAPSGVITSDYCRQIVINEISTAPYDKDEGPKLQVLSRVWWVDRNCPRTSTWPGVGKCSLQLEMDLANWKDY